jgi:predicted flap endonuclease-1-like 5' DNA nuclease
MGFASLFQEDNLQIIEGVGPKIEGVLQEAGYRSWEQLAAADANALRTVLADAGKRFQLADPSSWPHQASLAAAGNWDELIRYQKFTDGGRETTGDFVTPSKFEKLATKKMGFSSINPNDLKVVEGIGPKIEGLFKEAGIKNWSDLSVTSTERMQEILTTAGDRYKLADPGSWAQQAKLAGNSEWVKLFELQTSLKGGK